MKKCVAFIIIILLLLSSCSNGINTAEIKIGKPIIYAELRLNSSHPCYYFSLYDNKQLNVCTGYGSLDEYIKNKMDISNEKVVRIDESDYNELYSLRKNLKDLSKDEDLVQDYWVFSILVNGKTHYYHTYGCAKKSGYDSLITKLIELSPIYVEAKPFCNNE